MTTADWLLVTVVPAIAGIASFIGTVVANKVKLAKLDEAIAWIKETLARHESELRTLHARITRHR